MQAYYWSLLVIGIVATFYTFALYMQGNKGWFRSEIGKLLISMSAGVVAFYIWFFILMIFPHIPQSIRGLVRMILFTILTLVIVWRAIIMTKLRLIARSERINEDLRSTETN